MSRIGACSLSGCGGFGSVECAIVRIHHSFCVQSAAHRHLSGVMIQVIKHWYSDEYSCNHFILVNMLMHLGAELLGHLVMFGLSLVDSFNS